MLKLLIAFGAIKNGGRILELGTGWVHWWSIVIRMIYDVQITTLDIWDNRQLLPLKAFCAEFTNRLRDVLPETKPQPYDRAVQLLSSISSVTSFDDLYRLCSFDYIVDPRGSLKRFEDRSFDVVFSYAVLEHINKDVITGNHIENQYRILKPGGYSIHVIGLHDHLSDYDKTVSRKNYLRYSNRMWKCFFENRVQYINRIQSPEWLRLYEDAGFELIHKESGWESNVPDKIAQEYRELKKEDLECGSLYIIHRKPME